MWLHDLVQVGVLGPLLVRVGDREATPRGQRQRDAFVALVQRRGRPVPADVLYDLIWPAPTRELTGLAVVHTAVARLRRIVGPGGITRNEHGYQLDPTVSTDEDAFLDLVDQARNLLTAGDPVTAGEAFRAALAIWRGERAFDDVRDELVEPDRARLDEVRTAVVEELTTAILDHPAAGTPAEAYALAARLIEQHPLRERAHQLAMLACYRDHHQVRALEIYRDLVRRLRTELGIEPGPATARLHAQILRQDVALEPPGPTGPPRRRRTTRTGPPAPVTPIIGREELMGTVHSALAAGRRLVTLTGPPGVGKSRLLQEIGADDRPDRIVYVRLDGADVPDRVGRTGLAAALAVALG
ncbi:MAG TPA: BTAD domain-containing putative transcriptional regulator, partial [Nakamurella sp.]